MTSLQIRKAVEDDVPNLLPLKRELAEFEDYASDFAVTEEVLREQGFRRSPPDFHCLIAEEAGELVGFLVYYFVPFTYRAKPNLIIKELYIAGRHRSRGVGKFLMKAVARQAEKADCGMIKWWVAKWNERGIEFTNGSVRRSTAIGTNSSCRKKRFAIWLPEDRLPNLSRPVGF